MFPPGRAAQLDVGYSEATGPMVGTERRSQVPPWDREGPGVAWPSVDGLEHGWPGSVGVVGAECHLFAGLVLGALHVEFHADSPVGIAAENQPLEEIAPPLSRR